MHPPNWRQWRSRSIFTPLYIAKLGYLSIHFIVSLLHVCGNYLGHVAEAKSQWLLGHNNICAEEGSGLGSEGICA